MKVLHRDLLQAVWLCCLLAVQVQSCPDACRKCLGTEKDQCLDCRAGWMLHNNICVGTVCRIFGNNGVCMAYDKLMTEYMCFDVFQTLMSVALSWVTVLLAVTALIQRAPSSVEVSGLVPIQKKQYRS